MSMLRQQRRLGLNGGRVFSSVIGCGRVCMVRRAISPMECAEHRSNRTDCSSLFGRQRRGDDGLTAQVVGEMLLRQQSVSVL